MENLEKEVISYLRLHCAVLYVELKAREKRLKKVAEYLRSHKNEPHVLPFRFLYRLMKKIMIFRANYLNEKNAVLQARIKEYKEAQEGLKKGDKTLALKLLEEIRKDTLPYISSSNTEIGSNPFLFSFENPLYKQVNNLITELSATA